MTSEQQIHSNIDSVNEHFAKFQAVARLGESALELRSQAVTIERSAEILRPGTLLVPDGKAILLEWDEAVDPLHMQVLQFVRHKFDWDWHDIRSSDTNRVRRDSYEKAIIRNGAIVSFYGFSIEYGPEYGHVRQASQSPIMPWAYNQHRIARVALDGRRSNRMVEYQNE